MFEDFIKTCAFTDGIRPSRKRVNKAVASLRSRIESEGAAMTKQSIKIKPLITAAVIISAAALSVVTVNAASGGAIVKFMLGENEITGYYGSETDEQGVRRVMFNAELPIGEVNFAVIFDIDAPDGENVRVITDETDRGFMDRLRMYENERHIPENALKENGVAEPPSPEEYGIVFKDSEICIYELERIDDLHSAISGGFFGGEFMRSGNAEGKPSGVRNDIDYDHENGIKTYKYVLYYYTGADNAENG